MPYFPHFYRESELALAIVRMKGLAILNSGTRLEHSNYAINAGNLRVCFAMFRTCTVASCGKQQQQHEDNGLVEVPRLLSASQSPRSVLNLVTHLLLVWLASFRIPCLHFTEVQRGQTACPRSHRLSDVNPDSKVRAQKHFSVTSSYVLYLPSGIQSTQWPCSPCLRVLGWGFLMP